MSAQRSSFGIFQCSHYSLSLVVNLVYPKSPLATLHRLLQGLRGSSNWLVTAGSRRLRFIALDSPHSITGIRLIHGSDPICVCYICILTRSCLFLAQISTAVHFWLSFGLVRPFSPLADRSVYPQLDIWIYIALILLFYCFLPYEPHLGTVKTAGD